MNPELLAEMMAVVVASAAGLVVIGLGARVLWRMGSRKPTAALEADPERLRQLEQALDAIAIEVERISEAQRYTVALLSDRLPARTDETRGTGALHPLRVRHDTPH
jgi:hypothetical protein